MKTIKPTLLALLTAILFLLNHTDTKAQFEQKLTMQFSGGASFILSEYPLVHYEKHDVNMGMIYENILHNGLMLNGGLQYNFSRKFSLIGLIMYGKYNSDSFHQMFYSYHLNGNNYPLQNITYFNLGIGISGKYKFIPHQPLRPYLLFGLSGCFVKQEFTYEIIDPIIYEQPVLMGLITGLGLEFDLSDNFTLFVQGGFNKVLPLEGQSFPPTESLYSLLGLNINFFKARTL